MIPDWARPLLQAALDADDRALWTLEDVDRELAEGVSYLWLGHRSAVVASPLQAGSTGEKVLHIWLAGGELDEITSAGSAAIEGWARANGFTQMTVDGRLGWIRALRPLGYELHTATVRKILT